MPKIKIGVPKTIAVSLVSLLFIFFSAATSASLSPVLNNPTLEPVADFQLVKENHGWVLIKDQLYWTSDNGATWTDITPEQTVHIRAVQFTDLQQAYLISQELTHTQEIRYSLLITRDQGQTWSESVISSYSIRTPDAVAEKISVFFLNEQTGWVIFKQATSPNFNSGRIILTSDGGQTWKSYTSPLGEPAKFLNENNGYMSGGVFGHQLYRTSTSGAAWESVSLHDDRLTAISSPNFLSPQIGFLAALSSNAAGTDLNFYTTFDGGSNWDIDQSLHLSNQADISALSDNLPGEIKLISGNKLYSYFLTSRQLITSDLSINNPIKADFASSLSAWVLINNATCLDDQSTCESTAIIFTTSDGGATWQPLPVPEIPYYEPTLLQQESVELDKVNLLTRTSVLQGQGFDQCEISSLSNLKTWKSQSPLSAVNLYIGGSARGCPNENLSKSFVEALSIQGWKFIPTWVGPQAACTDYSSTMHLNPITAKQQGRDQATDAIATLQALGLSEEDGSGTVVYYDLEAFNVNNEECLRAAEAFINGWVERLNEANVTAGVYGSACASGLDHYYDLPNPPDVIWPAYWRTSTPIYNSTVTPYGLPCISDLQWGDQQRVFQYTGPHTESWGNVAMYVDLDVIDGIVADLSRQVGVPDATLQNPSFETASLSPWEIQNDPTDCNWEILNSPADAQSEDYLFAINKDQGDTNCSGIQQTLIHTPVYGDRYRFAVWARSASGSSPRTLTLKITGEGESTIVATQYFSDIREQWVCLETNLEITSSNLTRVIPAIELGDDDGIDIYLDNAHVSLNTGLLCPTIPAPSNLRASDRGDLDSIIITWDPVQVATHYELYRSIAPDTEKYPLAQQSSTEFIDTNAGFWDEYQYWVQACNAGGCSPVSRVATGRYASPYLNFFDGFESGDNSNWTTVTQPDLVTICTEAALNGRYGLCVDAGTTGGGLLTYDFSDPTREVQVGFKIDPNSFNPGDEVFTILKLEDTSIPLIVTSIKLRKYDNSYQIMAIGVDQNGSFFSIPWVSIPDSPSTVGLIWNSTIGHLRSTAASFSGFSLWVNGTQAGTVTGLLNQAFTVDRIVIGGLNVYQGNSSSGIFYLDDFFYQPPFFYRP